MELVLSYLVLFIGVLISGTLLNFGIRLFRANKIESKKSAARSRNLKDAVLGRARIHDDWIPDARVKGGLVYNRKKKRLEVSGRLSSDSLDRVFR